MHASLLQNDQYNPKFIDEKFTNINMELLIDTTKFINQIEYILNKLIK
jgi:hypothetical protein